MSNDLVSQPWSQLPSIMGQMEQMTNNLESPIPAMKMGFVPDNSASQQLSPSKLSMDFVGSMSKEFKLQKLSMLEVNSKQADAREKTMALLQNGLPPRQPRIVSVMNNHGTQQSSALTKRKAPMEPTSSLSPRSSSLPNKRPIQMMEHRPWLQGQPGSKRAISTQLVQQVPGSKNLPPQNKKSQIESSSPRPAPQKSALSKSQNVVSSSKVGGESSGSVRSKMRESLAAALALVTQQASKAPSLENKDEASVNREQNTGDQPDTSLAASQDGGHSVHEEHKETLSTVGELVGQTVSSVAGVDGCTAVHMRNAHQNFQSDMVISTDDVPFSDHFFVKDELLQGNGLTWMLESDIGMVEGLSRQTVVGNNLMQEGVSTEAVKSPEDLAAQIEAELFKLFGGVNKKYREKGRSLLFNLKDRSNPELRERVVSGEISPERLCSMTAEELASKELSEWRMAKAEEFASMVVLPDSSADVRRLVKKTHKGEFEVVEIEQDEGISEEVSLGARSTLQSRPRENQNNSSKVKSSNVTKEVSGGKGKSSVADQDGQIAFTIPPEDQVSEVDIMVEDALGNLPPIVSLDEFMESLDTEPPFEELQVQDGKTTESPEKDGSEKNSPKKSLTAAGDAKLEKPHKTEGKETLVEGKSNEGLVKSKSKNSPIVSEGQHVWQGSLQLNISSTALVVGIFKSGEKITTKDWSSSIEIKGRVRLDAFEKFLQDLRMSRSRALMVIHFLSNNGAPETERASITEVGESYVTDERVGFSEPCKGVELYFCPPHTRTLEMLSKILPEDQIQQELDSVDCGLIGVVIWRRNQFADNNSPSSHKHNNPKKPHLSSFSSSSASKSRHDKAVNVMSSSRLSRPQRLVSNVNDIDDDDDDDVPPGFGPTLTRDADDLPEFNFAGGRSAVKAPIGLPTQPVTRPVEQIRELILKYGQTGGSEVPLQPWNDDDDDIPEWQPHQVATPRADLGDNNPVYPLVARATKQHIVSPPPPPVWPARGVVPYGGGVHGRQTYHQPRGRGY